MTNSLFFYSILVICALLAHSQTLTYDQMVSMQYVNEIQTWIPQYIVDVDFNKITGIYENHIGVNISKFNQQILPASLGYNTTQTYGYSGKARNPITGASLGTVSSFPGPTITASCGKPLFINYTNTIPGPHILTIQSNLTYDPLLKINTTITQDMVPSITHVHGAVVESTSDGYPGAYTTSTGVRGPEYNSIRKTTNNSFIFYYPNHPTEETLFYHDHTIGMTRLNVYAGLVGFYKIQNPNLTPLNVISPKYDILLAITDRTFFPNSSYYYPNTWVPEFFADTIVVNGKVWPKMTVKNSTYRLRILNGCNARFLNLTFNSSTHGPLTFTLVKGDEGYLYNSANLTSILMAPSQRYQILIDFSNLYNSSIEIINDAGAPFPDGDPANFNPNTTGRIMRIDVLKLKQFQIILPRLPLAFPKLHYTNPIQTRQYVIIQNYSPPDANGNQDTLTSYLGARDTSVYLDPFVIGQIYEIDFINLTPDAHPIHIHLTNFQVIGAIGFDWQTYRTDYVTANGNPPIAPNVTEIILPYTKYLTNQTFPPSALENGLKDAAVVFPGTIKMVRIRFTQFDGSSYPFDATKGYGFAFHCHILEHQDNSMMRLFRLYKKVLTPQFIMNEIMP